MKLKLGPKEIQLNRVEKVTKAGRNIAKISFCTGEAILVKCAVQYPDRCTFTYPGAFDQLKVFIENHKAKR